MYSSNAIGQTSQEKNSLFSDGAGFWFWFNWSHGGGVVPGQCRWITAISLWIIRLLIHFRRRSICQPRITCHHSMWRRPFHEKSHRRAFYRLAWFGLAWLGFFIVDVLMRRSFVRNGNSCSISAHDLNINQSSQTCLAIGPPIHKQFLSFLSFLSFIFSSSSSSSRERERD